MLSLCELRRAARVLEHRLDGAALHRIVQPGNHRLALAFRSPTASHHILLSCRPDFARVSALATLPQAPAVVPSLTQYLRAHAAGALFEGVRVAEMDRQIGILLRRQDCSCELVLSILGARSNIYLLDTEKRVLHTMRPLRKTRRELTVGEAWSNPPGGVRSAGVDRWLEVPDSEYLEAIEETYERLERSHEVAILHRKIGNALDKEEDGLSRKILHLHEDLGEARKAEEYRRQGELLKNVLHMIKPGDSSAAATDYETGEQVEIALEPGLSPAENLEQYFARYQKQLRGVRAIEQQIGAADAARAELEELRGEVGTIVEVEEPDLDALERFAAQPRLRRLLARYYPSRKPPKPPVKLAGNKEIPSRLLPKRYRTKSGLEIWVGRSDEGNDFLTTRLARGNDLFFHLEGYPGSHVVLRTEGRGDPPLEAVLDACELAVHFSKLKKASSADVHIAPIKNVKKPKDAKPGLVYVSRGRTIHLRCSAKRLEHILASRIDEP